MNVPIMSALLGHHKIIKLNKLHGILITFQVSVNLLKRTRTKAVCKVLDKQNKSLTSE